MRFKRFHVWNLKSAPMKMITCSQVYVWQCVKQTYIWIEFVFVDCRGKIERLFFGAWLPWRSASVKLPEIKAWKRLFSIGNYSSRIFTRWSYFISCEIDIWQGKKNVFFFFQSISAWFSTHAKGARPEWFCGNSYIDIYQHGVWLFEYNAIQSRCNLKNWNSNDRATSVSSLPYRNLLEILIICVFSVFKIRCKLNWTTREIDWYGCIKDQSRVDLLQSMAINWSVAIYLYFSVENDFFCHRFYFKLSNILVEVLLFCLYPPKISLI